MKQFRFSAAIIVAMVVLFSCNSGDDKKVEDAPDTTAVKPPEPTAPVKPQNTVVVTHKVANFDKWLAGYETHDSVRLAYGLHSYVVGRGVKDTNMVFIAMRMDDYAKAKEFSTSANLKDAMKKAGVQGAPTVSFGDMQLLDTTDMNPLRLRVTHKVKDYDTWKKEFDSHEQARRDAGLTLRALAYSMDDRNQVAIVFNVADMKKAEEFGKSADLKAKMEQAGVEGPPAMFFYRVVKKY